MFWERAVENAITQLRRNVKAPVRLVFSDGREIAFSDNPRVTLRLMDSAAAAAFRHPNLLTLAEAYIEGKAELEGDVIEAIRGAEAISRAMPQPLFRSRGPTNGRHTKSADREAVQHHYDVSNEFYALWLDPRLVYSCAYFQHGDDTLEWQR